MSEHDLINSRPFDAPFVRVRGRLSRQGVVIWSPCLRTFHPPGWVKTTPGGPPPPQNLTAGVVTKAEAAQQGEMPNASSQDPDVAEDPNSGKRLQVVVTGNGYVVTFEDALGKVLASAPVRIRFFTADRQWALFRQRLPYHKETHRVVLLHGERELGALSVSKHLPEFVLTHPVKSHEVDVHGVLHMHWKLEKSEKAEAKKHPLTYYVRYRANGGQWYRPGVNIKDTSFDLDLREMPGGEHCVAQVIATNGYQTSYVETPPFAVPCKPPEILLATPHGPLLFAQGFSREEGPIVGESIVWLTDGKKPVGTGASFDARHLRGMHQLSVRVTDSTGAVTIQHLGWYDGETGMQVVPEAGN
jgi:hypothetical protein